MARSIRLDGISREVDDIGSKENPCTTQDDIATLQHRMLEVIRITFVALMIMLSVLHGAYLLPTASDPSVCFQKLVWMAVGNMLLFTCGYVVVRAVVMAVIRRTLEKPTAT